MVSLRSIHSGPEQIRSSFCGPIHLGDSAFAMSVDEPLGGPVVIRVTGDLDGREASAFAECVGESLVCGRSLVVDLLDVRAVDRTVAVILNTAANTLRNNRSRAVVACRPDVEKQILAHLDADSGTGLTFFADVASAITGALTRAQTGPAFSKKQVVQG